MSSKTELELTVEALTSLASAITWTVPNDSSTVSHYVREAFDAIDKLKALSTVPDDGNYIWRSNPQ